MDQQFDIFLSHNSADKPAIREIRQLLEEKGLSAWLDEEELQPGISWMTLLEAALCNCKSAGAFVGSNGVGSWERKEIEALLIEAVDNGIPVIPVLLPGDYEQPKLPPFLRTLTYIDMRSGITPELIDRLIWGITGKKPGPSRKIQPSIHPDRLPTVKGEFFGRKDELALLDKAWKNQHTHILQFIAPGGTGKTKLLRHWLDNTEDIGTRLTWSFYSQGISDNKQVSATPFFIYAFSKLSAARTEFITEEEKGEYLADLLRKHSCTLVLDGLEPLQHAKSEMRGELKDRAMRALLKSLATDNNTLCIITTRIAVHELSDRAHVTSRSLQNLALEDGVKLLISLGVKGTEIALMRAVKAYGCNALALSLLGNALRIRHEGDVRQRDNIRILTKAAGNKDNRHAFKVMQAYEDWFAGAPELALLYLLGLFDQPIGKDVMQVLWDANIPNLTTDISEDDWLEAIDTLRNDHSLLFEHEGNAEQFDCHPLIREYFGKQLRETWPDAWQRAHAELYNYYRSLPDEEQPETLEDMYPLFRAVEHGCLAGLYQQAFTEIYWKRISREKTYYLAKKGACGDDLSNLIHFFQKPWEIPAEELDIWSQASVLRTAGHRLRALGRIREAIKPFTAALKRYEQLNDPKQIAITASNLIEPYLTLGNVKTALRNAEKGVNHPDPKFVRRLENVSIFARTLHQAGRTKEAREHFIEAEKLQHDYDSQYRFLHSLSGFRYSELLLEENQFGEVLERAHYALEIAEATTPNPLYIGLARLILGRLSLLQAQLGEANKWLESALISLREAGNQDHLPRGLLTRSTLYRHINQTDLARQDLQEVFDIANGSGMRLHLTDGHLEMARLLLAEEETPPNLPLSGEEQDASATAVQERPSPDKGRPGGVSSAQAELSAANHVQAAAKLIQETGYHRRDQELAELQQAISSIPQ
ncbi:toll/interleukin-1 receptor domain-containing protein [Thiothrix nivea]|uniref:TIR domain-containing protein n=1 Tax=Thiothrix nivea (strain ATCC 35100 / DSM 5205 / JP2) TaxID=870187 RepID=A0A656HGS2_THINJ|nr:toll/interleukin-1 receptor domain-containing protein [Thiothrix nivea]EIJ35224.1 hypothetical protein Thini_2686 [Thiothrix nivea DSM 5205]